MPAPLTAFGPWEDTQGYSLIKRESDTGSSPLARHIFYNSARQEVASIDNGGKLTLEGPIGKIHGRANVGIASNTFDDLIFNYNGAAYWFKGTQGGGAQTGPQFMKLDTDGSLWLGRPTPRKAIDAQGRCLYG